jgi:DNA-binding CsgD family transcriptional regulator
VKVWAAGAWPGRWAVVRRLIEAVPAGQLDAAGALLLGEALYELGVFDEAERVLARGQELPSSENVALRLAVTRSKNANWGLCQPQKALAINAAARAVITARPLAEQLVADEAAVLMFSGHPDRALAVLDGITGGDQRTRIVRAIVGAVAMAATGRTADAVAMAESGFAEHTALGDELAIAYPATHLINLVFALTEAGRLAEAGQLARAGAEIVASHRVPIAQIWFAANLGRVATLRARDGGGLAGAAGDFEALGAALLAAEAASGAAAAFSRAGDRRAATAAQHRANALGADCEGAVTPGLVRAAAVPLSGREREIAMLAAEGMASKDIAERLYLSVRTVNNHLQHVYAKLGVSSRAGLGRALRSGP